MADVRTDPQVAQVSKALRALLRPDLAGMYLFGSAATSGLKPTSDLDLMAVTSRATTPHEKRALVDALLGISGSPRPLELTIVVAAEVRPWRYPPCMDFQFGEWWRDRFERGEVEPWGSPENPDLASLIRMVLAAGVPLLGPPPSELFDAVPRVDYVKATLAGLDSLVRDLEWDARNVVLTLARVWVTLATDTVRSKQDAADWVRALLPPQHRRVLAEARDDYLGVREPWAEPPLDEARAFAAHAVRRIRALAEGSATKPLP